MSILLVQRDDNNLRAAVMDQGRLLAYGEERKSVAVCEDQIYIGIVDRAIKGINAVFVRLPDKEFGFLPIQAGKKPPASGDRVIVQVKRPPTGIKKAMLSQDVALAGTHVVYLPFSNFFRVSAKVDDAAQKTQLKALAKMLMPKNGGIILRSSALNCDHNTLAYELETLIGHWETLQKKIMTAPAPSLLLNSDDLVTTFLREEGDRLEYVLTNAETQLSASIPVPIRHADAPFMIHNVESKLTKALRRTVLLKSGASLVIDVCEALTVIDVNSAMASGGQNISVTAEKINMEAASEIARLLRLRGIGGMIIIDFIDMDSEEARERVIACMQEHLRNDPLKTTIYGFTQLGFLEMTRRRGATPLPPLNDQPCPHCAGSGVLLTFEEDLQNA